MGITLSWDQYYQLWEESWAKQIQKDPKDADDWVVPYPDTLAFGYKRHISLRHGMHLTLHDCAFHQDTTCMISPEIGVLEFVFNLSSPIKRSDGIWVPKGQHYLINGLSQQIQDQPFHLQEYTTKPKEAVDIHLGLDLWQTLVGNECADLPLEWQAILTGSSEQLLLPAQCTTPNMQMVLQQICSCPYKGSTKQLFLESKALELLALQLNSLLEKKPTLKPHKAWSEQIHQAKEILDQRIIDPPSLLELARLVGLNDRSLKAGFRHLLGTTVFGYLHQKRMELARELLASGRLTIPGVASAVGYASPTAFSKAFRKQFGISPKKYQMQPWA